MNLRSTLLGLALLALAVIVAPSAKADLIVAGTTALPGTAIMDLTLLPGTPFNPGASAIFLQGVSGNGVITINRDAQSGSTITIASLSGGMYYGSNPNLGSYVFGNVAPLTGADFSGVITNVVQNSSDPGYATGNVSSFQSGDFSFTGNSFGFQFLTGPAAGITLFTDPTVPFHFAATFNGLPPSEGTVLQNSGTDVLNVLFNGQIVAQTSNRFIILRTVPEPSSLALMGVGIVGFGIAVRRRRRSLVGGRSF